MVMGFRNDRVSRRAPQPRLLTATDGRDILTNNSPAGWEINQPWLWWLPAPNGEDPVWGNPPPGGGGGWWLSSLPGVTQCTRLIADTIAGLPWQVFTGWVRMDPTPTWLADPQLLRPDGRVNPLADSPLLNQVKLSGVELWTQWITSALWWGDGYVTAVELDSAGQLKPPLYVLNPHLVDIVADQSGAVRHYYVNDVEIPGSHMLHLRGEPPYFNGHGVGVLTRHAADLGLAMSVREYAQGQYHAGVPAGYLKSSQPRMDEDQAAALKARWMEQHGDAARSIAVLNATTEFVPLNVSPLDAQLDAARNWSLRDIALMFGVPPDLLDVQGNSSTYANVESRMIQFRQLTLLPWIRRIEATLDAEFPAGTNTQIQTAGLERADTATRYAALKIGIETGLITRDEGRALENLPPLGAPADPALPNGQVTPTGDTMSNPPTLEVVPNG
jgi:HK97 family phage portal protein